MLMPDTMLRKTDSNNRWELWLCVLRRAVRRANPVRLLLTLLLFIKNAPLH